jgi:uncharacterized protein (TIGR00297 family)
VRNRRCHPPPPCRCLAGAVALDSLAVPASHLAVAALLAVAIAAVAWRRRLLDPGGAVAATLLGPALVATGGWWLGAILVGFFLTAALLPEHGEGAPCRTWQQVLANGGPALVFAIGYQLTGRDPFLTGAAATIAATTADTWATEIGRAIGGVPWSVRTRRRVPPGTSGAVSTAGTLATVAGAILIAAIALLLRPLSPAGGHPAALVAVAIAVAGALGSLLDTALGATLQGRFACTVCGARAESPAPHRPGHPMRPASGIPWLTNGAVNLAAALAAGLVALALATIGQ